VFLLVLPRRVVGSGRAVACGWGWLCRGGWLGVVVPRRVVGDGCAMAGGWWWSCRGVWLVVVVPQWVVGGGRAAVGGWWWLCRSVAVGDVASSLLLLRFCCFCGAVFVAFAALFLLVLSSFLFNCCVSFVVASAWLFHMQRGGCCRGGAFLLLSVRSILLPQRGRCGCSIVVVVVATRWRCGCIGVGVICCRCCNGVIFCRSQKVLHF